MALLGVLLLTDRPGLRLDYFALSSTWEGSPVFTTTAEPEMLRPATGRLDPG